MTCEYWTRSPERARAWVLSLMMDGKPFAFRKDERGHVVQQEFPDQPHVKWVDRKPEEEGQVEFKSTVGRPSMTVWGHGLVALVTGVVFAATWFFITAVLL